MNAVSLTQQQYQQLVHRLDLWVGSKGGVFAETRRSSTGTDPSG